MTTLPDFSDPCLPLPARSDDAPWASHAWVIPPLVRAGQTFTDRKGPRWFGQRLLHLPQRPPSITGACAGPARLLFGCFAFLLVLLVAAVPGARPRLDPLAPLAAMTASVPPRAHVPSLAPADPTSSITPSGAATPSTSPPVPHAAPASSTARPTAPSTSPTRAAAPSPSPGLAIASVPAASPRPARAPLPAPLPAKPWPRVRVLPLEPPAALEDELGLLPIPVPSSDMEAQG